MLNPRYSAGRAAAGLRQAPDHPPPTPLAQAEVVADDEDATTDVTGRTTAAIPRPGESTSRLSENKNKPMLKTTMSHWLKTEQVNAEDNNVWLKTEQVNAEDNDVWLKTEQVNAEDKMSG